MYTKKVWIVVSKKDISSVYWMKHTKHYSVYNTKVAAKEDMRTSESPKDCKIVMATLAW